MKVLFNRRKQGKVVQVVECEALNVAFTDRCMGLIELVGADTAVRAVWAHLMKARLGSSSDSPDSTDVYVSYMGEMHRIDLAAKERYIRKALGTSIIICRKGFEPNIREYFPGGDLENPSPYFLESFRLKFTNIPVLPKWSTVLWQKGIEAKAVKRLDSASENSQNFWSLSDRDENTWREVVKEVVTTWQD